MLRLVNWDNDEILDAAIEAFEKEAGEQLFAGDERLWLINSFMYMADVVAGEINHIANNNLIMHCDEETLMLKAEERFIEREPAEKASVKMQFTITGAGEKITIPKGTRATAEGTLFFELPEDLVVAAGQTTALATMQAVEAGASYNDVEVGKITILVDTIPYVTHIENTEAPTGGKDIEDLEQFRLRVLRAPKQYKTTGAQDAYIENAKAADSLITDVQATNNGPDVYVYVLCKNGIIPNQDILDEVEKRLTASNKKALVDRLHIAAATPKNYTINLTYKIARSDFNRATEIQGKVQEAVQQFISDMQAKMNIDINPEILRKYIYNAGASSVSIASPNYASVGKNEVAKCTTTNVAYDGVL